MRFSSILTALAFAWMPSLVWAQSVDVAMADWHRAEVQQGVFTVKTPCAPDDLKFVDRKDSPGIQCRFGDKGVGFGALVTRNGLTPNTGDDTFDGIYAEISATSEHGAIEIFEIAGRRAFRATNPFIDHMIVQVVELGEIELAVLLYVGEPFGEEDERERSRIERQAKAAKFFDTLEFID